MHTTANPPGDPLMEPLRSGGSLRLTPLIWEVDRLVPVVPLVDADVPDAEVTILHTNDFHSSVDGRPGADGEMHGGLAKIATTFQRVRTSQPTLVLDAGDAVFGSGTWWNAQGARAVARLRKHLGYHLAAIGNHDLEHGLEGLRELTEAGHPFVSANITVEDTELQTWIRPAYIADIAGMRLGITGATTLATLDFIPRHTLKGITLTNPLEALLRTVAQLEPLVDAIILLTHLGSQGPGLNDCVLASHFASSKVAVILGGHSHDALNPALTIDDIVVCNAGAFGANVGEVKLKRNKQNKVVVQARLIQQDKTIIDDTALVEACSKEAVPLQPLHETTFPLPPLPESVGAFPHRDREWLLLAQSVRALGDVDADAVLLVPFFYVLGQLPGGKTVTLAELSTAYQNAEHLVEAKIEGSNLKELMRLQESLLYYQRAHPFWLVSETAVLADQVNDTDIYTIIITELVSEGGLGWKRIRGAINSARILPYACYQLVHDYLQTFATHPTKSAG